MKRTFLCLALLAVVGLLPACSGGGGQPDPKEFYKTWTDNVGKADAGKIYDALDSALQHNLDMDIERMKGEMSKMDPEQRAKWESLKDLKGRDAYIKLMGLTKDTVTAKLAKDYKILKVDTVIVMTVQHGTQDPILEYLRWEKGGYRVTEAPQAPVPVPTGHPPVEHPSAPPAAPQGTPDSGGSAGSGAAPDMKK